MKILHLCKGLLAGGATCSRRATLFGFGRPYFVLPKDFFNEIAILYFFGIDGFANGAC